MKSYGRADSSLSIHATRRILEDARDLAVKYNKPFQMGMDENRVIVIVPGDERISILACGVSVSDSTDDENSNGKKVSQRQVVFWNHSYLDTYAFDEAVQMAHGCLARRIITYRSMGFLSESSIQLEHLSADARAMASMYGVPFVMGLTVKKRLMIAPVSRGYRFFDAVSCIVSESGIWTISEVCSHNIPHASSWMYPPRAYLRRYGSIAADRTASMTYLQNALEDAEKLGLETGTLYHVGADQNGIINISRDHPPKRHRIKFITDGRLQLDMLADAAEKLYVKLNKNLIQKETSQKMKRHYAAMRVC